MERLTKKFVQKINGRNEIQVVLPTATVQEAVNRLAELEDELENGTLLKAPCKVGDEMWILNDPYFVGDIFAMKVEAIEIRSDEVYLCGYHKEASEYLEARISFAFKTKEEAEKRLEELRG